MTSDLLNSFSTGTLVVLVVGGTTLLAVLASLLIRWRFPNLANSDFENLTGILRADVFALLFSIVLGLVIADQSGNLAAASATISQESSALAELAAGSEAFDPVAQVELSSALDEYLHAVVEEEFESMRTGEASPRAAAALEALHAAYREYEPQTEVQRAFYSRSVENLGEVILNRRDRIQQSQEGLSPLLRTLLLVGAFVFILLAYPASIRSLRIHLLIVAATASFVSFAYLMTIVLDYPYAGDVSVDSSPYKLGALAQFWGEDDVARPLSSPELGEIDESTLLGKWNSQNAYGELLFRKIGGEIRAAYRLEHGTVTGELGEDGVFRGWWCQEPDRKPPDNAGEVEWRLLKDPDTAVVRLDGRWRYGSSGSFKGGWDLTKIRGVEPADLINLVEDSSRFCAHP
ncbi:MAG TPA: hypothetical protein VHI31_08230 [Actinomycetota bacterium]|nr:hypothetical protein [Actinomycetota bacterium]